MLYGPNTNLGHNSIVYMLESQIRYIKEAIVRLRAAPGTAFDVRSDVQSGFNKKLQHSLRNTVWAAGCKSWYIAESGKIVNNWGGFTFSYRRLTRRFDPVNYQAIAAKSAAPISDDLIIRESSVTKLARLAVKTCLKPALRPALPVAVQRRWAAIATRTLSVPFGVHFSRSTMAGVPVETVRSKSKAPKAESAVLFLHGGAFVLGSPVSHRSITGRLARYSGVPVFVPDYRLAPEHPFPAALDDALACYRALLERGYAPERIAVAGDSAGGGLALSLCLRLRSEGLTQPACLALISPWADLTLSQLASIADDALLRDSWLQQGARAYLRGRTAREPLVSPLLADLAGLPPTLIQAGSEEILRNDSRRLAQAMTAVGVFVVHREFARMWHDFQLYAGVVPEATAAIDEIARFVDSNASRPLARQPKHEQQRLDVPDDALMSRALPASGN
jgi:acetyl esterase/lipase